MNIDSTADRELVITREFQAPRELVWEAWTNPQHVIHWWGPNGFTNTIHEMNVTPGGVWRFIMHGTNNQDFPNRIVFKEVIKPTFLSYEHGSDVDHDPRRFQVTVTFESKGKATELTMKMVFSSRQERDDVVEKYGAIEGNRQTMNKLEAYLTKMQ